MGNKLLLVYIPLMYYFFYSIKCITVFFSKKIIIYANFPYSKIFSII